MIILQCTIYCTCVAGFLIRLIFLLEAKKTNMELQDRRIISNGEHYVTTKFSSIKLMNNKLFEQTKALLNSITRPHNTCTCMCVEAIL